MIIYMVIDHNKTENINHNIIMTPKSILSDDQLINLFYICSLC